jgi:hypothetical protein
MRLWNLVNGRAAFDQKLSYGKLLRYLLLIVGLEAEIIRWSPSGNFYAICSFDTIRLFDSVCFSTFQAYPI